MAMNSSLKTMKGNLSLSLSMFLTSRMRSTLNNKEARCDLLNTGTSVPLCLPQNKTRKSSELGHPSSIPLLPLLSFSYSSFLFLFCHHFQTFITWLVYNLICLNSNSVWFQKSRAQYQRTLLSDYASWKSQENIIGPNHRRMNELFFSQMIIPGSITCGQKEQFLVV